MSNLNWDALLEECVDFARRLIMTPSMPGEEAEAAQLIADEMRRLDFDDVWLDEIGNVSGRIRGRDRDLGSLVLNSHTDHVDLGELSLWQSPPYAGEIRDGRIYGRGACDIKGPLAVQLYGMAALLRSGVKPRRDIVFSGVVEEEIGGAGAAHWVENLDYPVELVLLGEPSSNNLSLGHRGILQMWVTFQGKSVHASVPEQSVNPNFALAAFLIRLDGMKKQLGVHPILGPTTVTPTIIEVDTSSLNVTPAWSRVLLDFRTATESVNSLQAFVQDVAGELPYTVANAWTPAPCTPFQASDETIYGYYTVPEEDIVRQVKTALTQGMGREPILTNYNFATDGRHFVPHGLPILGYSPGEEHLAHRVDESISIRMMAESLRGHRRLLQII